jgi:hypothetical protein
MSTFPSTSPPVTPTSNNNLNSSNVSVSLPIPSSSPVNLPPDPYASNISNPPTTSSPTADGKKSIPWLPPERSTRSGTQGDQSSRRDYYNDETNVKLYCSSCDCFHNRDKFSKDKKGNVRFTCNRTRIRQNETKKRKKDERGGVWGVTEEEIQNGTYAIIGGGHSEGNEQQDETGNATVELIDVDQVSLILVERG